MLKNTFDADHFDFLINNAGTTLDSFIAVATLTEAQFDEMYHIHLKGVFFLTQKALPVLNNGGRIINLSSIGARMSYPGVSAYSMMKGGVTYLPEIWPLNLAQGASPSTPLRRDRSLAEAPCPIHPKCGPMRLRLRRWAGSHIRMIQEACRLSV